MGSTESKKTEQMMRNASDVKDCYQLHSVLYTQHSTSQILFTMQVLCVKYSYNFRSLNFALNVGSSFV